MPTYTLEAMAKAFEAWRQANDYARTLSKYHPPTNAGVIKAWQLEQAALQRYIDINETFCTTLPTVQGKRKR